ncbi:DUF6153 family protein [Streptomyces sp. NPDC006422]|uniref:DUF6153 family protein n=1 Tax=unclassified Streptomyces TaxID=2593676 RepID=UPI0033A5D64C
MARARSAAGRWQRLLLFAGLLFGIVCMHTLGHPSGHGAGSGSGHGANAAPMTALISTPMPAPMSAPVPASAAHDGSPHAPAVHEHAPDSPGHGGMDPLNVCLAVLGSFTLLVLLTAVVLRPLLAAVAPGPRTRGLSFAQRPNPPPPRRVLSLLSVLRI